MFTGCGTALVTPFGADLSVDEQALRRLVRRQVQSGVHFLVPCGTTGENPTLNRKEQLRVIEITLEEAKGKVPVVAGAGGYNTAEVAELAKELEAMEVDGLLSVTPYYNRPTPEGLYQHYKAIAAAAQLPIVVYNVPARTGTNITAETLHRLASIDNVVGVKEASGNIGQIVQICQSMPRAFAVLSGDDAVTLPLMALGGVGVISVVSNEIPAEMAQLCDACLIGDFAAAREIHARFLPLMEVNFVETSPGPVKAALAIMGLGEAHYRLPIVAPRPESRAKIEKVLNKLGLVTPLAASAD
jgi:4-hydroxy-tetrahydrodipicolinate synthase